MALQHINVATQTTATILHTIKSGIHQNVAVQIYNGHSAAIYIGDSTVTTSGATIGRPIAASGSFQVWLNAGDSIWGISAAASAAGAIVITYSA
jgi:type 1 fimbria pilin